MTEGLQIRHILLVIDGDVDCPQFRGCERHSECENTSPIISRYKFDFCKCSSFECCIPRLLSRGFAMAWNPYPPIRRVEAAWSEDFIVLSERLSHRRLDYLVYATDRSILSLSLHLTSL